MIEGAVTTVAEDWSNDVVAIGMEAGVGVVPEAGFVVGCGVSRVAITPVRTRIVFTLEAKGY